MTDGVSIPCFWIWELCDSLVSNNMCWRFCWICLLTSMWFYLIHRDCHHWSPEPAGKKSDRSLPCCEEAKSHRDAAKGAWVGSSSLQVLLSKSQICEWTSSQMTVAPSYWVNPRHGGGEVQASHPPLFPFWIPAPKHTNKHIALHFCVWGNVYYVAMVTWTIWKNGYYFLGVKTSV